jgi:hypothetical protein
MRLLPKSEVSVAKAAEKKRDIDEGLKLARRIDNLRELTATEDAIFRKFRNETIAKIHEETTKEQNKLDTLKGEVKVYERRKEEAQKPLDEEWIKVAEAKSELDRRREVANETESLLDSRERDTGDTLKRANSTLARAKTREGMANDRLQDADRTLVDAKLVNEKALRLKERVDEHRQKVDKELLHRDAMASSRERSVTIREEAATVREKNNRDETIRLADMRATLERETQRRLKKSNVNST